MHPGVFPEIFVVSIVASVLSASAETLSHSVFVSGPETAATLALVQRYRFSKLVVLLPVSFVVLVVLPLELAGLHFEKHAEALFLAGGLAVAVPKFVQGLPVVAELEVMPAEVLLMAAMKAAVSVVAVATVPVPAIEATPAPVFGPFVKAAVTALANAAMPLTLEEIAAAAVLSETAVAFDFAQYVAAEVGDVFDVDSEDGVAAVEIVAFVAEAAVVAVAVAVGAVAAVVVACFGMGAVPPHSNFDKTWSCPQFVLDQPEAS